MTIILKERIYIPEDLLDLGEVERLYTKWLYDEMKCSNCEYLSSRHSDTCDECPGFTGAFKLWVERTSKNGVTYIGLPSGNRTKIKKLLPDLATHKKLDKRPVKPLKHKIEFTGKLRSYQVMSQRKLRKKGYGMLEAPPRSGKTVMATSLMCAYGMKTLILASQHDWLEQFWETIMGGPNNPAMTNIPDLEKFHGRRIAILGPKTEEDFRKHGVVLSTYQKFLSKGGKKLLNKIKDMFSVVIVDEAHKSNAECFSRVLNNLNVRHRFGLTATPDRKDGRQFLAQHIIGPVVAKPKVDTLKPVVTFVETGTRSSYAHKQWVYALRFLERQTERNKLILKWVLHDLKAGHSIVIPVVFKSHVATLVKMINQAVGKKVAVPFTGAESKEARRKVIVDARSGKIRVVVGMRQLVQLGINVPRWSCIYEVMPISNPPNLLQEISRVLTPMEGKPRPVIRYFVDTMGVTRGCLRTCIYQTHVPHGHEISKYEWAKVMPYVKRGEIAAPKQPIGKRL